MEYAIEAELAGLTAVEQERARKRQHQEDMMLTAIAAVLLKKEEKRKGWQHGILTFICSGLKLFYLVSLHGIIS